MSGTPKKDLAAFKRTYRKTKNIQVSALAAGYSQSVAVKGVSDLAEPLKRFVRRHDLRLSKLAALGRAVDAENQENIVRGRLLVNVHEGNDKAVQSCKALGQDKRVGMWASESQTGILNVVMPADFGRFLAPGNQDRQVTSGVTGQELPIIEAQVVDSNG